MQWFSFWISQRVGRGTIECYPLHVKYLKGYVVTLQPCIGVINCWLNPKIAIPPLLSGLWPLCKPFWTMLLLCWPPLVLLLLQLLVSSATALLGWLECLYSCYLPLQYRCCLAWIGSVTVLPFLFPREWLSLQYIVACATCWLCDIW